MFGKTSQILYRLMRLIYKKKKVDDAINLRKVMNKEFLNNQSHQLEEYLIDLGTATNDAVKKLNIAPKKKRRFREGYKQIVVEILLKFLEHLPTNPMVVANASSLSPVDVARITSKAQKRFQKMAHNLFFLKIYDFICG